MRAAATVAVAFAAAAVVAAGAAIFGLSRMAAHITEHAGEWDD